MSEIGNSFTLIKKENLSDLLTRRESKLAYFKYAHERLKEAQVALSDARNLNFQSQERYYNHHLTLEKRAFFDLAAVPDVSEYMETATRIVDTDCWSDLVHLLNLERIMDHEAKVLLRDSLISSPNSKSYITVTDSEKFGPPAFTLDNVLATVEHIQCEAKLMFFRGIANAFSKLCRRFRSHSTWKIGSRFVLPEVLNKDTGHWNYNEYQSAILWDIERVFCVLDDPYVDEQGVLRQHELGYRSEIITAIDKAADEDQAKYKGRQGLVIETRYFRVRTFKNGNIHIWFLRDDLVEKVNLCLAEYYGEVLAEGDDHHHHQKQENHALRNPKYTLAHDFGFFPTPLKAANRLIGGVKLKSGQEILEPSAGTGNLARLLRAKGAKVTCVEVQPHLADQLRREGFATCTVDFLKFPKYEKEHFDHIVMNPPFNRERDIDHVMHVLNNFVGPGISVHAIMSAGTEFRQTKKSQAFREFLLKLASGHEHIKEEYLKDWKISLDYMTRNFSSKAKANVTWEDLPAGSFTESGTNVNTCILRICFK